MSLFLFQYFYYGDFLPNTYYLKTGGFALIEKIPRGVLSSFNLLPLLVFVFSLFINKFSSKKSFKLFPVFSISFFLILYNIYIGGDAWEVYGFANRFITPIIPIIFASVPIFMPSEIMKKNKVLNIFLLLLVVRSTFLIQLNVNQLLDLNL